MSVKLRAPTLDDLELLTDLINRDAVELYGTPEENIESMRLWLTGPGLDPVTDIRVAVEDGSFRGYVDIDDDPHPIYYVDLRVPPSELDEIRVALLDWAERRGAERGAERLRFHNPSVDASTIKLLEGRGYGLIRHFYRMRIDFDADLAAPGWPDGLTVRPATKDDAPRVYEAHQDSFRDHWEFHRQPYEEWEHHLLHGPFDPSLWFLVEDGDELAAVAINREHEAEEGLGWVSVLGVREQWRRRGLGRALLLHTFHEFRRRGFHSAALGVDADSLTGANRLYESVGMRVIRRGDVYEKAM